MTSVGFCGMDSYISPYDLRTYPSYINQTLADDTSLNNVNVQMVGGFVLLRGLVITCFKVIIVMSLNMMVPLY